MSDLPDYVPTADEVEAALHRIDELAAELDEWTGITSWRFADGDYQLIEDSFTHQIRAIRHELEQCYGTVRRASNYRRNMRNR